MGTILSCWKDIAQYLGKGVRTVQRWEADFGLPVRRPRNGSKQAVTAIPEELDAWVRRWELSERGRAREDEIERLRKAVALLQAENAALKLQLSAVDAAGVHPQTQLANSSLSGGNGHEPPWSHGTEATVQLKLQGRQVNGRARNDPRSVTFISMARNGTTDANASTTLVENVEQLLRSR